MGRTNIEIDDVLIERAMRMYRLRSKREVVDLALRRLVGEPLSLGDQVATTDVVLMEVLAGARDDGHRDRLRALLARCEFVPVAGPRDHKDAADIHRACRQAGLIVRALTDCLIASVAMRAGLSLLHTDRDFDAIARRTPLEIA